MMLTYRGRPVMRLEPIDGQTPQSDDLFYQLHQLAEWRYE